MARARISTRRAATANGSPSLGVSEAVRRRIVASARGKPGRVFTPHDFSDLGSAQSVAMALRRLEESGQLSRIGRGLYERPRVHPKFGALLPSTDEIADALALRGSMKLQPSGASAANMLGLTEQVPLKSVFFTDGSSRTVRVGQQQIVLRHASPRTMATAGRLSGVVIQALRHLKRENVDDRTIAILRRGLGEKDKAILEADARHAPAWIAQIMRSLASSGE